MRGWALADTLPRPPLHLRYAAARNVHPKYVKEPLRHATVAITLEIYSHMIPRMGNYTARALEDVFS